MDPRKKSEKDEKIFGRIISSNAYKNAHTILTYVSTDIEVDTRRLIEYSLEIGKKVAVPRCIKGTREMDFYFIGSTDCLERGMFGVSEPVPERCEGKYTHGSALCIIPGLAYDMKGYRLGYGKGYYDRFLSDHRELFKMGICYCSCTYNELIHGKFDISSDMLITEKYTKKLCTERS